MFSIQKLDNCKWGSHVICDDLYKLTDDEFLQIGKQLVDHQVVVVENQQDASPFELQNLCSKIGDLEGYTSKLKIYADPNTPEARADWADKIESPSTRQRSLDYTQVPGVMKVTGKLKEDGSQTGFFGHDRELDWHCNKASDTKRHSYVTLYSVYGSEGSKTSWLDTSAAYIDLPDEKKEYYSTLDVICGHKVGAYSDDKSFKDHINRDVPWPLVQQKYNKIGLFFPFHQVFDLIVRVTGEPIDQFEEEHQYLINHILNEKYMYHHYWKDGDIVMSDQDITLHKRWHFSGMKDRLLWRLAHDVSNCNAAF